MLNRLWVTLPFFVTLEHSVIVQRQTYVRTKALFNPYFTLNYGSGFSEPFRKTCGYLLVDEWSINEAWLDKDNSDTQWLDLQP